MNKFLLTLFVVFFTLSVSAQIDEKEKLEQRKEQLQRELSEAKTKLQNEKKKENSHHHLESIIKQRVVEKIK